MKTLMTSNVPIEQLDALEQYASGAPMELRELLLSLSHCVRDGDELVVIDASRTVTPSQAAGRLGMSRSHLYKLLDRGEIPYHHVGRDRRIRMQDIIEFEEQRQRDRRELAERFARHQQTTSAVDDEIADLL